MATALEPPPRASWMSHPLVGGVCGLLFTGAWIGIASLILWMDRLEFNLQQQQKTLDQQQKTLDEIKRDVGDIRAKQK